MVKPRLSISSCSTQLGQAPLDSTTTDWFVSTVSLTATSQRRGEKKTPTAAREQIQHIIHVFLQKKSVFTDFFKMLKIKMLSLSTEAS